MSNDNLPVISDPQFVEEADNYFLECLKKHANLYDENDVDFNDELKQKYAWGLVAKYNSISVLEAKEKWELLKERFYEENNLLFAFSCCDEESNDNDDQVVSSFCHYNVMKQLLTLTPENQEAKKTEDSSQNKTRTKKSSIVSNGVKQARSTNQAIKIRLNKKTEDKANNYKLNPHEITKRIIFKELQRKNPEDANKCRIRLVDFAGELSRKNH